MSRVMITVRTEDGGDVEVEERSSGIRAYAQDDVAEVGALLDRAAAKVRAAYGITDAAEDA